MPAGTVMGMTIGRAETFAPETNPPLWNLSDPPKYNIIYCLTALHPPMRGSVFVSSMKKQKRRSAGSVYAGAWAERKLRRGYILPVGVIGCYSGSNPHSKEKAFYPCVLSKGFLLIKRSEWSVTRSSSAFNSAATASISLCSFT